MRDPYEVLNLSRDADDAAVKAAFRRLAKELHPDLNPGDERIAARFREAVAAHDFLRDEDRRARFDAGLVDAAGNPTRGRKGGPGKARPSPDTEEAAAKPPPRDTSRKSQTRTADAAAARAAYGQEGEKTSAPPRPPRAQSDTPGWGRRLLAGLGFAARRAMAVPGGNRDFTLEIPFIEAAIGATRRVTFPDGRSLDVKIPPGVRAGQKIRLRGQGAKGRSGGAAGDALVEIAVLPDARFDRDGLDISTDLPITLDEALLGAKIEVQTLSDRVMMTVPAGSDTGKRLRLKGKGITANGKSGDFYVRLRVVLPKAVDMELQNAIRSWRRGHAYKVRT